MATVTLTRVYLHVADDLVDSEAFYSSQPGDTRTLTGEVRPYAAGRLRIITRTLRRQTIPLTLIDVSDVQLAWLDEHMGHEMVYRDPRARLLGGAYFAIDPSDYKDGSGWEVPLTFQLSTWSPEV